MRRPRAEDHVTAARQEAERMLSEARAQAQAILERARVGSTDIEPPSPRGFG